MRVSRLRCSLAGFHRTSNSVPSIHDRATRIDAQRLSVIKLQIARTGEKMGNTRGISRAFKAATSVTIAALAVAGLTLSSAQAASAETLPTPPPLLQRDDSVVTSDALPTVQIDDGYVWAQTTIGSTVYAVGDFDNARAPLAAPGTQLTPRSNVLAFDINTGALLPFAPSVNGVVKSVFASPDGTRVYIGGSFTQVNGQTRYLFAALDAVTGQLVPGFAPSVGGSGVYSMTVSGSSVYVGGLFTQANGTPRKNLAAFNAADGALLPWAPETDLQVDAMVLDPNGEKVIVGGRFSQVNANASMRGTAALDKLTGEVDTSWAVPKTVKNGMGSGSTAGKAGIFSLATDASGVYGTGWVYANAATGNLEGTFAAEAGTGEIRWIADCLGDHYGVYSTGKTVYTTSHTHACSTMGLAPEQNPRTHKFLEAVTADVRGKLGYQPATGATYVNWEGTPAPSAYAWYPDLSTGTATGLGQAGLSITGVGNIISVAGEFRSANNLQYQGIVRFSTTPPNGPKDRPRLSGTNWVPSGTSFIPGRARIAVPANWDRDDMNLTYELRRQGVSMPVATLAASSTWWKRPSVILEDTTASPGAEYTYTVVAKDGAGNTATSAAVSVEIADGSTSGYVNAVVDDAPQLYYALGSSRQDWAGGNNPVFGAGTAQDADGVANSSTGASTFDGSSNGRVVSESRVTAPSQFTTELWFNTTTRAGGKIMGYGDAPSGNSGSYDRHIYMRNNGQIVFGVYPGSTQTIQSGTGYNDGKWHHVAATQSSDGMKLYVDGQLVSSNSSVTTAQAYSGYWRLGGDNLNGWPSAPSSFYFNGSIDEVAVYDYPLSLAQVRTHYGIGSGFVAPTAAFMTSASDLSVSFDASTSAAAGSATISSYTWDFGDDSAGGSGATITHEYAASGTYTAKLTVTDSNGLVASTEQEVTVAGPNLPPTAAFSISANGLTATGDASTSGDADGTITSYEWDWGDSDSSTGQVASHTYASPGTYSVTLTVIDDRGGSSEIQKNVEVTHAAPVAAFTASASGLTVAVDGQGSSASDGATLSYDWKWGDGESNGSGGTASHKYADSGDYEITLTVTDSLGLAHATTKTVSVTAEVYTASDQFERTVSSGWGAADKGGTWSIQGGSASVTSVSSGVANINNAPGGTRELSLNSISLRDTLTKVTYSVSAGPSTGNIYAGIGARYSGQGSYRAAAWHRTDGSMWLVIQRAGTSIASLPLSGYSWSAGSSFQLATEVSGSSPTTIKAKIWAAGTAEPAGWQLQATDSASSLQAAGAPSLYGYRSGSSTGTNVLSFDDYTVTDRGAAAENSAPVAAFAFSVSGLTVSVDGSTSTDSDGTVASYEWDFGDGAKGKGASATHAYGAAGDYTVVLTVTDNVGATHSTSHSVVVSAPPADNVPPVAAFTSSVSGLTATVDGSTSSDTDGSIFEYSWSFGDGKSGTGAVATHSYASAGTYAVTLTVTDDDGATHAVSHPVTVTAPGGPGAEALLRDDFERTSDSGWGAAAAGGTWKVSGGSATAASVSNGAGKLALAVGSTRYVTLDETPIKDGVVEARFQVTPGPETGSSYIGVVARQSGADRYMVRSWLRPDGSVWLVASRGSTLLASQPISGLSYLADTDYILRVSVTGSATTTLSAKIWRADSAEPESWQMVTTDSSASALQGQGASGVVAYRAGSSTAPLSVSFDSFVVTPVE